MDASAWLFQFSVVSPGTISLSGCSECLSRRLPMQSLPSCAPKILGIPSFGKTIPTSSAPPPPCRKKRSPLEVGSGGGSCVGRFSFSILAAGCRRCIALDEKKLEEKKLEEQKLEEKKGRQKRNTKRRYMISGTMICGTMLCRASSGPCAPPVGVTLQVGSGFSGECVRTGKLPALRRYRDRRACRSPELSRPWHSFHDCRPAACRRKSS